MRWSVLGALLEVASILHPEPERSALRALGDEVADLDRAQRATSSR